MAISENQNRLPIVESYTWSRAELSIAKSLALQVRLMTADQVSRGWFGDSVDDSACARRALDRLRKSGLVERFTMEAHPLIPQNRPLFVWKVGMAGPTDNQLVQISDQSRNRWRMPHAATEIYRASKRTCHVFGAFVDARAVRHCEATHDLHVAEVYVTYRRDKPRLARDWLGEGAFPKLGFDIRGMKDPDAFLVDRNGNGYRVIEFTGTYEPEHLHAIHAHCAGGARSKLIRQKRPGVSSALGRLYSADGISYELW